MNAMKLGLIWLALGGVFTVAACASCTPSPVPPTSDAGSVGDAPAKPSTEVACALACSNLSALGCREGAADAGCSATCALHQTKHTADLRPWCVLDAGSAEAVNACGGSATCTR